MRSGPWHCGARVQQAGTYTSRPTPCAGASDKLHCGPATADRPGSWCRIPALAGPGGPRPGRTDAHQGAPPTNIILHPKPQGLSRSVSCCSGIVHVRFQRHPGWGYGPPIQASAVSETSNSALGGSPNRAPAAQASGLRGRLHCPQKQQDWNLPASCLRRAQPGTGSRVPPRRWIAYVCLGTRNGRLGGEEARGKGTRKCDCPPPAASERLRRIDPCAPSGRGRVSGSA